MDGKRIGFHSSLFSVLFSPVTAAGNVFWRKKKSLNFFYKNIIFGVIFLFQNSMLHPPKPADTNKTTISGKQKLNYHKLCMYPWPVNAAFDFICFSTFTLVACFEGLLNAAHQEIESLLNQRLRFIPSTKINRIAAFQECCILKGSAGPWE